MTGDSSAGLYPRYCLHLSPTFNNWCLLHVTDIHALRTVPGFEVQDFYFHENLPIKWVRIVGIVVAVQDLGGRRIYTVDDSSGACIECIVPLKAPPRETAPTADPWQAPVLPQPVPPADCMDVDVGSVVDIKGGLTTFRDEMQVKIEKVKLLKSTEQEVALWERRARFRSEVLLQPWVLSEKQIRRCRKEEMREKGGDDDKERKRKKEKEGRREERKREVEVAERRRREKKAADKAAADEAAAETQVLDRYHLYQMRRIREKAEEKRMSSSGGLRRHVLDESLRGKYSALGL
ncbi:OB-fold nucleic acid binding domain-containing protein [Colletotrichum sojae]|uniref:OB-fold nucleic acid binding domain-containing protein n=1 Tax=Colletotrichum sojae TaxID=2175907 RepID=A0A8H6JUP7_9PEZI|nr:OB-fold nucleic acid binding domain-containing protein [Colletotrichum sojae]